MCQQLFSCVFFDWDLTLAYTISDVSSPEERLTAIFQTAGFPYSLPEVEEAFRKYNESVKNGQLKRNGDKNTQEEIMQFYKDILVKLEHLDPDSVSMNVLYNAYANLDVNLYDDTLPLFRKLKENNIKLGIITNHSKYIRHEIEKRLGKFIQPEHIIISQEVGEHKPSETIFKLACNQLKISPEKCVFVGNDLYVDAIGAVVAGEYGMGIWLNRHSNAEEVPNLPERVFCIRSLHEVPRYLFSLDK
ncbi:MAG: HAD family hydrolase [Chloroflexi bacterium]|nr:HAD family hydrolase [Chloroflexota bacterium]MBP7041534.1 HAD family hydrolase [Chloroflexota bacterium]